MAETYNVVLLVEQALSTSDAHQVHALHEGLDTHVTYHVVLPIEDAAANIEAAMGTMLGGDMMASPAMVLEPGEIEAVREEAKQAADEALDASISALRHDGADAVGVASSEDPVDALAAKVKEVDAREAIILTRPHVVAEFFHVDWTSRARRKLGVPVLHLLEHESLDEQAVGRGEGITGF